jgi:hypothetical protein
MYVYLLARDEESYMMMAKPIFVFGSLGTEAVFPDAKFVNYNPKLQHRQHFYYDLYAHLGQII